jgi:hypothetical protein
LFGSFGNALITFHKNQSQRIFGHGFAFGKKQIYRDFAFKLFGFWISEVHFIKMAVFF